MLTADSSLNICRVESCRQSQSKISTWICKIFIEKWKTKSTISENSKKTSNYCEMAHATPQVSFHPGRFQEPNLMMQFNLRVQNFSMDGSDSPASSRVWELNCQKRTKSSGKSGSTLNPPLFITSRRLADGNVINWLDRSDQSKNILCLWLTCQSPTKDFGVAKLLSRDSKKEIVWSDVFLISGFLF